MSKSLLWKLCGILALGMVSLFWLIHFLTVQLETQMSFIAPQHQQTLLDWGKKAEQLYRTGDDRALKTWLEQLQDTEKTWAAVVTSDIQPAAGSALSDQFIREFRLGRSVSWKIHLYFKQNPIMDITFADGHTHFLIRLPQRMRPGRDWPLAQVLLQVVIPVILLVMVSIGLYRHVVSPINRLQRATKQLSEGNFEVRVSGDLGGRKDELAALAETFDEMAERTENLVGTKRQLIADLSHELRTPITRIDIALNCIEQGIDEKRAFSRVRREVGAMRKLAEDCLTLAWLEQEKPVLNRESLDLVDLLNCIIEDAGFEYPDRKIITQIPDNAVLTDSCHRALGQAIENILRNALRHTPPEGSIFVLLEKNQQGFRLIIKDQGPGVPDQHLSTIFKPFFRIERGGTKSSSTGFGLGLALAHRQIQAVGGTVAACNLPQGGLEMSVQLKRIATQ